MWPESEVIAVHPMFVLAFEADANMEAKDLICERQAISR